MCSSQTTIVVIMLFYDGYGCCELFFDSVIPLFSFFNEWHLNLLHLCWKELVHSCLHQCSPSLPCMLCSSPFIFLIMYGNSLFISVSWVPCMVECPNYHIHLTPVLTLPFQRQVTIRSLADPTSLLFVSLDGKLKTYA